MANDKNFRIINGLDVLGVITGDGSGITNVSGTPTPADALVPQDITNIGNLSGTNTGDELDATSTTGGVLTDTQAIKFNTIAEDANNYIHPTADGDVHIPANGTTNENKVLTASAFAGVYTWETAVGGGSGQVPVGEGTLNTYEFTATASQTVFTGVDNYSNTLVIEGTFLIVSVDGSNILNSDFTYDGTSITIAAGVTLDLPVVIYNFILNGPGIGTQSTLPPATLNLFNSIVFEVGNKPYICTANSDAPTSDNDCFWVSLT